MTDRELLELAAKAAGQERSAANDLWSSARGMLWDPLNDDGDALRLAVALGLTVEVCNFGSFGDTVPFTRIEETDFWVGEDHRNDACAATRRAIVRAAAALAVQPGQKETP